MLLHFPAILVPVHTTLLFWSESVNELVKQTKMQQCQSRENIHTTDWPDVPWNIFPKLPLDWSELTCSVI